MNNDDRYNYDYYFGDKVVHKHGAESFPKYKTARERSTAAVPNDLRLFLFEESQTLIESAGDIKDAKSTVLFI